MLLLKAGRLFPNRHACHRVSRCLICSNIHKTLSSIDPAAFFRFIILALLVTPPNYIWQKFLEDSYPTREAKDEKRKDEMKKNKEAPLSITNTAIKFVLDQSVGCWANTIVFIVAMGFFKGQSISQILTVIEKDFWSMVMTGYRLWPMVCLLNLLVVPFEYRMLVGNVAAFGWGVFISLTQ